MEEIISESRTQSDSSSIIGDSKKKRQGKYNLRKKTITTRVETEERLAAPKVPKPKSRPPPLSKYRRRAANTRERTRMKEINTAFQQLQTALPINTVTEETANMSTVTKITTLRLAVNYIAALRRILGDDNNDGKAESKEFEGTLVDTGAEISLHNNPNDTVSENNQGSSGSESAGFFHQLDSVSSVYPYPDDTPKAVGEDTSRELRPEERSSPSQSSAITETTEPVINATEQHSVAPHFLKPSSELQIEGRASTEDKMDTDLDPETNSWLHDQLRDEILRGLNNTVLLGDSQENLTPANELILHPSDDHEEDMFDSDASDKHCNSDLETLYNSCIASLNKDIDSYEYEDRFPLSPDIDSSVDLNNNVFPLVSHAGRLECDFIAASHRS